MHIKYIPGLITAGLIVDGQNTHRTLHTDIWQFYTPGTPYYFGKDFGHLCAGGGFHYIDREMNRFMRQ